MKLSLLLVSALLFFQPQKIKAQAADSLLQFITTHKDKSSVFLKKNDTVIASLHENRMMPLASTMKIMVAIEFAKQAAHHVFDPESSVALSDLDKYYIPNVDGGAHPNWIAFEKQQNKVRNDSVSLLDVARGMIMFSSNANTEYLMDVLGLGNINNNYRQMGIKDFTPLYYFSSALMLYQNPKGIKEDKLRKAIGSLSSEQYMKAAEMIHDQLKNNPDYKSKFRPQDLTVAMQKEWSDRLPASTTKSYVRIAEILNKRQIYSKETYDVLSKVLETVMENPMNRRWLSHSGMKGGNTMFVLTKTLYATLKSGEQVELAYFFNDLDYKQVTKLTPWMNDFEYKILTDPEFMKKVSAL